MILDLARMSPEDRARAAERLLGDPLATGLLSLIEQAAIEAMLAADTDEQRREARDTVKTVRGLLAALRHQIVQAQEATHQPKGVV